MWTPERDRELRRIGADAFAGRYQIPFDEASARFMILFDPDGQAALLREKNRAVETGDWTQPEQAQSEVEKTFPDPWPDAIVEKPLKLYNQGLSVAEIAKRLGKTQNAVQSKRLRLGLLSKQQRRM